jgi:hypothetical protein
LIWSEFTTEYITFMDKVIHSMRSQGTIKNAKAKIKIPSIEIIHPKLNKEGVEIGD